MSQNQTQIIAHRGAWKEFSLPENSVASLQKAIELRCFGSEFDVRRTKDGILVINHDPVYFGDTIELHNYADLNKKKLSNGEDLPTLENYFIKGTQNNEATLMICEIKEASTGSEISQKTTTEAIAMAQRLGIENKIIYISFGFEIVKTIKRLQPNAIVLYLENNKSINEIVNEKINGINFHFSNFMNDPQITSVAKQNNLLIGSWTVNQIEDLKKLITQGVTYITTNVPAQFLAEVSKK
ncbi:MAG: glycerophosphodiester phosphodiesterase family protein [Sediminibacterium sp.]